MADGEPMRTFNVRMATSEIEQIERLRERLQERAALGVRVTQRMTILAALERLETHLDKLDRDKERER